MYEKSWSNDKGKQKTNEILRYYQRTEKIMEHKGNSNLVHIQSPWNNPEKTVKKPGRTGDKGKDWDCPNHNTLDIN